MEKSVNWCVLHCFVPIDKLNTQVASGLDAALFSTDTTKDDRQGYVAPWALVTGVYFNLCSLTTCHTLVWNAISNRPLPVSEM